MDERYYVIAENGQKYGPANVATLQQWVEEGRVVPHTKLQHELDGSIRYPGELGLSFESRAGYNGPGPAATYAPPGSAPGSGPGSAEGPYATAPHSPYFRPGYGHADLGFDRGDREVSNAWILGAVGVALGLGGCACAGTLGFFATTILCGIGMKYGATARAKGHPNGQAAYIFNLIGLIVGIIAVVASVLLVVLLISAFSWR
jgi:hypothetical protein